MGADVATVQSGDMIAELTEYRAQIADQMTSMASDESFDPDDSEWAALQSRAERTDKRIEALRVAQANRRASDEQRDKLFRAPARTVEETRDVGEQVLRSEAWRAYIRNGMGGRAHLLEVALNRRALITSDWLPGQVPRVNVAGPTIPTPLIDSMANVQVSNSSVELFVPPDVPPAGKVAEGEQKPESALTPQLSTVTLDTLAHWVEVSRRAVADESLVRDMLNSSLIRGLYRKAENDAAGAISGAVGFTAVTGDDMLKAIRIAVATVQSQGFTPNAVLLNPLDAADLDFAIWGIANAVTQTGSLFGMRVVSASTLPAGTAYVGDFTEGAKYLYRGAAQVYVSDSDVGDVAGAKVSNFKRNVLTYLAEMESYTAITQTQAIVKASTGVAQTASAPKPAAK